MIIDGKRFKGLRAYKVKHVAEYMYVWEEQPSIGNDGLCYLGFANLIEGDELPSCHCNIYDEYLQEYCTVKSFAKLPEYVQAHLRNYINN